MISRLRFYGRRQGRPVSPQRAALMNELLPRLQIGLEDEVLSHFPNNGDREKRPLHLEIGFGGGEHLAAQATANPNDYFIGCEAFQVGVASLISHIHNNDIANIRIFPDDARLLLARLPDACLDTSWLLYPDPWPKNRHIERRFLSPANLDALARTLKGAGRIMTATDVPDLGKWMANNIASHPAFDIASDTMHKPDNFVSTRYETKARQAGRQSRYIIATRKTR